MRSFLWFVFGVFAACLCVSVWFHVGAYRQRQATVVDTVVRVDTLVVREPVAVESVVVRYRTISLPAKRDTMLAGKIAVMADSAADSIVVSLPITQKEYADSSYRAWVSGFEPSLDSIEVYPRTLTVTQTHTVYRRNRWGLGVQAGMGVASGKIRPYVGIGISYNLFSW